MSYFLALFLTTNSGAVLVWALFFSFALHFVNFLYEIRGEESLILDKKTEKSYLGKENWKVLSYMREPKCLQEKYRKSYKKYGGLQCLPNVHNFCPVSTISAQYPICLPSGHKSCLMSTISAQWSSRSNLKSLPICFHGPFFLHRGVCT